MDTQHVQRKQTELKEGSLIKSLRKVSKKKNNI